jgi:hypothetical protein
VGRGIALATFVVGGLIVADLWAHGNVTKSVLGFGTGESKLLAGQKA